MDCANAEMDMEVQSKNCHVTDCSVNLKERNLCADEDGDETGMEFEVEDEREENECGYAM